MGSIDPPTSYSAQHESATILEKGILNNPIHNFPPSLLSLAQKISFTGSPNPSIPIPWRLAESAASLKALEACMLNLLITKKYGIEPMKVEINTDHASLYVLSPMITKIVDEKTGEENEYGWKTGGDKEVFGNADLHNAGAGLGRVLATNIYKTKDGRYYHCHGSMNPTPTLKALGFPEAGAPGEGYEGVVKKIQAVVETRDSKELDETMNEEYKQAGTIAYSASEFAATDHGKANAHVGLYELSPSLSSTPSQKPGWWPENSSTPSSPLHPLAGLKVLDLTRVIAAPSITRGLAQMGASVMRVTSDKITDMSALFHDLSWGKWECNLHLKTPTDAAKLRALVMEADVVVEGYRPGVAERLGVSRQQIFDLVKDRERGIIHVKENCYGWHGPWAHRSGWQQISDACCGVSRAYGRAMGNDEAVTPVFPNSDFCTGIAGTTAVLQALVERGEKGGNYAVDVALNYYSQWLVRSVGVYPDDVWQELWGRHGKPVFRHYHSMAYTIPAMLGLMHEYDEKTLFKEEFFERVRSKAIGRTFVQVAPVARWEGGKVKLEYRIGTRGNGVDGAWWPEDLGVEVVT